MSQLRELIKDKKRILKELDLYIEENLKNHKGNPIYEYIGSIVNNLCINHPNYIVLFSS